MTDCHPSPSPQHPRVAQLPSALRLLATLLGLHHRHVEPAQGGDTGGLAPLALPVVLRQGQEVGTTYLNYFYNAMILNTKEEFNKNVSGLVLVLTYSGWGPAFEAFDRSRDWNDNRQQNILQCFPGNPTFRPHFQHNTI